jgi:drug/metabolite transporter (DMT)-like permease
VTGGADAMTVYTIGYGGRTKQELLPTTRTWTLCLKLGSTKVTPALGGLVIASAAFIANGIVLLTARARGHEIEFKLEALWLLALAGAAAAGVDIFSLIAYERGLPITSSLIVSGTSTALVLVVGFVVLQEPVTWSRLLALGLIVGGILLLQAQGT